MAQQGNTGIKLKIDVSATLTAIVNLLDVAFPEQGKEVVDMTPHPTSGATAYRAFIDSGVRELKEFTATVGWDDTASTHAAVLTALTSTSAVSMSIEDPAGQEIIAFSAFIVNIARMGGAPGDGYKADITVRPTGSPTIT